MWTRSPETTRQTFLGTWALLALLTIGCFVIPSERFSPVSNLRRWTGWMTFAYLGVVLLTTPLAYWHKGTPAGRLIRYRKDIGMAMVFPLAAHVWVLLAPEPHYVMDIHNLSDVPGILCSTMVLILAVTSFSGPRRWLGPKRWKQVHRLVYFAFLVIMPAAISSPIPVMGGFAVVALIFVGGYRVSATLHQWSKTRSRTLLVRAVLTWSMLLLVAAAGIALKMSAGEDPEGDLGESPFFDQNDFEHEAGEGH